MSEGAPSGAAGDGTAGSASHGSGPPTASARFFKGHGLGNDYLVFLPGRAWMVTAGAVRTVCHPHLGVGGDGVVVVAARAKPTAAAQAAEREGRAEPGIELRMFNPDGGEFERSGNGLRVTAAALYDEGLVGLDPFTASTRGGAATLAIHAAPLAGAFDVSAELGVARVGPEAVGLDPRALAADGLAHPQRGTLDVVPVSIGNPHLVVFGEDLTDAALHELGPHLATHPALEQGANVQLVRWGSTGPRIRIWERGVGRTSASGTSACAVVVAAVASGRRAAGRYAVEMDGGSFDVHVTEGLAVTLRGPVQAVCTGELTSGYLENLAGG